MEKYVIDHKSLKKRDRVMSQSNNWFSNSDWLKGK